MSASRNDARGVITVSYCTYVIYLTGTYGVSQELFVLCQNVYHEKGLAFYLVWYSHVTACAWHYFNTTMMHILNYLSPAGIGKVTHFVLHKSNYASRHTGMCLEPSYYQWYTAGVTVHLCLQHSRDSSGHGPESPSSCGHDSVYSHPLADLLSQFPSSHKCRGAGPPDTSPQQRKPVLDSTR